ncbi:MAG: dihydropyrimidine dehydrogenase, partial [Clostridia bacterium]|nr:dihydropyrimidine dehydrogenase [Clostridia bacterium]
MAEKTPARCPMPTLDAAARARTFDEVALGYTEEQARAEAARCLGCKTRPCVSGCPVGVLIPDFLAAVREGEFERAYELITRRTRLPAVCGRVCPQETQCEQKCVRGLKGQPGAIGALERFVADRHRAHASPLPPKQPDPAAPKVAVSGSGPAGRSGAGELAARGYA